MEKKEDKYLNSAQSAMMKKAYPKAIKYFSAYIELRPADKKALYSLADAYAFTEQNTRAIKLYLQVAEDFQKKHFLMKSIAVCKKVLKIDTNNARAKLLMDQLYKDKDEEFESTRRFLETSSAPQPKAQESKLTEEEPPQSPSPQPQQYKVPIELEKQSQPDPVITPPISSQPSDDGVSSEFSGYNEIDVGQIAPPDDIKYDHSSPDTNSQFEPLKVQRTPTPTSSMSVLDIMRDIQEIESEKAEPEDVVHVKIPEDLVIEPVLKVKDIRPGGSLADIELIEPDDVDHSYAGASIEEITGKFKIRKPASPEESAPPSPSAYEKPLRTTMDKIPDLSSTVKFYRHQIPGLESEPQKLTAKNLLFDDLDRNEYRKVVELMEIRDFEKEQTIVKEGAPGDSMFIIVSGEVSVHTFDKMGKLVFLAKLGEGDFFGEISLLTGKPRTATIKSDSNTELLELKARDLPEIEHYCPGFKDKLDAFYRKRMRQTVEKIVESQFE